VIVNDPAYGSERPYNALRLAGSLAKRDGTDVRVFLLGDAVTCALAGQTVPNGYYRLDRMLKSVVHHGGKVGCRGTCLDARGIREEMLLGGLQVHAGGTVRLDLGRGQGARVLVREPSAAHAQA
jgi:uncharacterized protein involved in oxidation of intracellular sulfur